MMYLTKNELRQHIRKLKREYSSQQLEALSLPIVNKLLSHPRVLEAETVMAYYSLPDEVNTHCLVDKLVSMGKTVLLPKVVSDTGTVTGSSGCMTLHPYTSASDLSVGSYGIMEPNTPASGLLHIDLAIIPGMAFDCSGHRLGRGKGYYDRFLVHEDVYKIGICYPFQIIEEVPYNAFDIKMDEVIS